MESILNQFKSKSSTVETAENDFSNSNKKVTKVKSFSDYGIKKSGLNRGDAASLKIHLNWIKDGFVVDENYDAQAASDKKKAVEAKIEDKKAEKQKVLAEKKVIEDVQIPNKKQDRKNLKDSIAEIQNDLDNEMLETGFQSTNYYMYAGLTILLAIYLIFFYASTIYSAFFRSAGLLIETSGDDLAMVIGSIFDMNGILNPSPNLIIVYFGSFIFFSLGIIPHTIKGAYKQFKVFAFLLVTLVIDALLAYKIDKSIHEIKVMAGIGEENWEFWASENFYLVLAFGFLAYLVFGYMYYLAIEEKEKKNPKKIAQRNIGLIKEEIKEITLVINKYEEKIVELQAKVDMLESRIEMLLKRLNDTMLNPEVLSESLNSFYMGWRQFLNSSSEDSKEKDSCESVYVQFMEENFKTLPSNN
jgi:hypothetical protein